MLVDIFQNLSVHRHVLENGHGQNRYCERRVAGFRATLSISKYLLDHFIYARIVDMLTCYASDAFEILYVPTGSMSVCPMSDSSRYRGPSGMKSLVRLECVPGPNLALLRQKQ